MKRLKAFIYLVTQITNQDANGNRLKGYVLRPPNLAMPAPFR